MNNMTGFRPKGQEAPQGIGPENADGIEAAGTLHVHRSYRKNGEVVSVEQEQEVLAVRRFLTEPAKVGATAKRTINTAPYESFTIEASVYLPCYAEEAQDVVEYASSIAGPFVLSQEAEIRSLLGLKQVFNLPEADNG